MKQGAKRAGENEVYVVGDIVRTQCGQLGRVPVSPPPAPTTSPVTPQVIAVEMADKQDYLSMRLHLKLAQSKGRQQFGGEAEWHNMASCDQTETLHHGD